MHSPDTISGTIPPLIAPSPLFLLVFRYFKTRHSVSWRCAQLTYLRKRAKRSRRCCMFSARMKLRNKACTHSQLEKDRTYLLWQDLKTQGWWIPRPLPPWLSSDAFSAEQGLLTDFADLSGPA